MNRSLKQKDRGNDMDKYRIGINMLVASAIVRAVILCTPLGWLAIIGFLLNLACLAVAIGGLSIPSNWWTEGYKRFDLHSYCDGSVSYCVRNHPWFLRKYYHTCSCNLCT